MAHGKCLELNKLQLIIKYLLINKFKNRAIRRRDAKLNRTPVEQGLNIPCRGSLKFR